MPENASQTPTKILNVNTTRERVGGKSQVTLWRWSRDGHFPKPVRLGANSIGWLESEVEAWIAARAGAR